jgi:hypothetical protein
MEYSLVLTLMLLLSPMSSLAHFCTLVLPGFCLARLAVRQGGRLPWALLVLAALCSLLPHKGLLGERGYTVALWYGGVMWNAVLLFAGCAVGLVVGVRGTVPEPERGRPEVRPGRAVTAGAENPPRQAPPPYRDVPIPKTRKKRVPGGAVPMRTGWRKPR